ncbi:hypothetical protein [Primorskyibacter sp. S187A]|uniref:hypothetical protein n=1 Tax=Primorskyibacter sp. S187A TaxID=3415130 RepID=UPI003C7BEFDF
MKTFEHEVLTYDLSEQGMTAQMKTELAEWGHAGFEVVSVVNSDNYRSVVTVFLKRSKDDESDKSGQAA